MARMPRAVGGALASALAACQARSFHRGGPHKRGAAVPLLPPGLINHLDDPLACAVALAWRGATISNIAGGGHGRGRLAARACRAGIDGEASDWHWLEVVTT